MQITHKSIDPRNTKEALNAIRDDLCRIYKWSVENHFILNPEKSKMLVLGTIKQVTRVLDQTPSLILNGKKIPVETEAKYLGVIIDSEMRNESHINSKVRTAFYKLREL